MKYVYSIILLSALVATYFFFSDKFNKEQPLVVEYQFNNSNNGTELKKLSGMSQYNDISEAPLFAERRAIAKKNIKKKIKKKNSVVEDLKVQALGVALTGEGVLAVIKDLKNGKITRLRIDEQIYGWTLESVSDGKLSFKKNTQIKVIAFKQ